MSLKEKIEQRIATYKRGAWIAATLSLATTIGALCTSGDWQITLSGIAAWEAFTIVRCIRRIRKGRAILTNPFFYLAAIKHDLTPHN